jgi:threonine 3-dehydrogenase
MIEFPATGKPYSAYVQPDTRLAILYVKDAVKALLDLHYADETKFGSSDGTDPKENRVFNLKGIVGADGQPPSAQEIADAVNATLKSDLARLDPNPDLTMDATVRGFGVLDEQRAVKEWGWEPKYAGLQETIDDFIKEVRDNPDRLLRLELYG